MCITLFNLTELNMTPGPGLDTDTAGDRQIEREREIDRAICRQIVSRVCATRMMHVSFGTSFFFFFTIVLHGGSF